MLSRNEEVAILDLYWSIKFTKGIQDQLQDEISDVKSEAPIDLRKL